MVWSRICVDVGAHGEAIGACVERFHHVGDDEPSLQRTCLSAANLVEFPQGDLWMVLMDLALEGPEGWPTVREPEQLSWLDLSTFDNEEF